MKKLILVFTSLFSTLIFSQDPKNSFYQESEQVAEFPDGGAEKFRQLVADHFREKKVKAQGKEFCELIFIIERDGSVKDIKANGTNESFNKEAIRAISKIKTKWIPGRINGESVRYRFRIPLELTFD